ncbi:hypothetical protein [Actinoplanes sp. G11-F43]|uniref:hypothetical protein n=1 Tax=Actinoplanes sp. G11-F43 TaxID=3424130 RepID=UPI003D327332
MRVAEERLIAAIEAYVAGPLHGEVIKRPDGSVRVITDDATISTAPAEWWIADMPGVREAVRIRRDTWSYNHNQVYGVLFTDDGMLLLNDRATIDALGRRLGDDVDPFAYAEVVAEFWSVDSLDVAVATACAADFPWRSGELFIDSGVYPDPVCDTEGDGLLLEFYSGRGFIPRTAAAGYHVYHWRITATPGSPPTWHRTHLGFDGPGF